MPKFVIPLPSNRVDCGIGKCWDIQSPLRTKTARAECTKSSSNPNKPEMKQL